MTIAQAVARLALAGCCLAAVDAAAQSSRPPQPGVQATGNLFGGYDAPLFTTNSAAFNPTSQSFAGGNVNLDYNRPGRRVGMGVSLSASNRYYPDFKPSTAPSYGISLSINSMAQGRWSWRLGEYAHYAPLSAETLFAGVAGTPGTASSAGAAALAAGTNFQISTIRQVDVNSMGEMSYAFSRRDRVAVTLAAGTQLQIDSSLPQAVRYDGRVRVAHDLTRSLNAYLGYGVTQLTAPAKGTIPSVSSRIDGYDFGVDFRRPFQLTRNTTFNFSTGLSKVPNGARSEFQLVGAATLTHKVGQTWAADLSATRDARFVQAYRDPVVLAGISASYGGQVASRVSTSLSANYSSGNINASPNKVSFNSAAASVNVRYDIRRRAGAFIEYSLFRSKFDAAGAPTGFPTGSFGRHGVRVGLSLGLSPFSRRP